MVLGFWGWQDLVYEYVTKDRDLLLFYKMYNINALTYINIYENIHKPSVIHIVK